MMTLAELSDRTGLAVLDHLERQVAIPVLDGPQAQGDLLVIPLATVEDAITIPWSARSLDVPAQGIELLRGAAGGNPHTLVADPGACRWRPDVWDLTDLALGVVEAAGTAYLLHPEHGATGLAPGAYVIRRQREHDPRARALRLVAD